MNATTPTVYSLSSRPATQPYAAMIRQHGRAKSTHLGMVVISVCLFCLGCSATLDIDLGAVGSGTVRLPQAAALLLVFPVLLFMRLHGAFDRSGLLWFPVVWVVYSVVRYGIGDDAGRAVAGAIGRSIAALAGYVVAVKLMQLARSPRWLWCGLFAGGLISITLSSMDIEFMGYEPRTGNNRWVGLQSNPNHLSA
ncbi:MAG: hypothetical protein MI757_15765, partial [Pirellulales bacterium]|nr:hypothetical protein [Pirellulales bacterium]